MEPPEQVQPTYGNPSDVERNTADKEVALSGDEPLDVEKPAQELPPHMVFPEGGARAWGVALGTAGVLFSTFGYANAFGSHPSTDFPSLSHDVQVFTKSTIKPTSFAITAPRQFPGLAQFRFSFFSVVHSSGGLSSICMARR